MRSSVRRRLGVLALVVGVLVGGCTSGEGIDSRDDEAAAGIPPVDIGHLLLGADPNGAAAPPRTLAFGDVEVVEMSIGEDAWAPVAVAVHAIRRADRAAVAWARGRRSTTPRRSYYADVTLTFEGLGVIEVTPFLTLAQGSRETNIHHYRLSLNRPFPPCPGTEDGVVLRGGEPTDVCMVFPGPRPDRVRGISMIDEEGSPTWEGPVS